jgi:hypothetical protein
MDGWAVAVIAKRLPRGGGAGPGRMMIHRVCGVEGTKQKNDDADDLLVRVGGRSFFLIIFSLFRIWRDDTREN